MRKKVLLFLIVNLVVVGFLVHSVWPLLCLLVVDGIKDGISPAELPAPGSHMIEEQPQIIPKIIHQTYITCDVKQMLNASCHTQQIPEVWLGPQQSCKDLHEDYEYKLWTDEVSRNFIVEEYPWFLDTWDGYQYPIQRADAIRYFAIHHFGGIYIDLDNGCQRRLDPLLAYHAWVRRTKPTGIGNDVMGAVPMHPFIEQVTVSLKAHDRNWFSPYITIMSSTGPLFFSLVWRFYNKSSHNKAERVRILFPAEYMSNSWSFFSHHRGDSWHMWDAKAIFWMGQHWVELTLLGFAVGFSVIFAMWWLYNRATSLNRVRVSVIYSRMPFWRRANRKDHYELVSRHEV